MSVVEENWINDHVLAPSDGELDELARAAARRRNSPRRSTRSPDRAIPVICPTTSPMSIRDVPLENVDFCQFADEVVRVVSRGARRHGSR